MNRISSKALWAGLVPTVILTLAILAVLYKANYPIVRSRFDVSHPVSLHITYQDKEVVPGSYSGESHAGVATYEFSNALHKPIKLAFPPVGYTWGGLVPITSQCSDAASMPEFCRKARIIELAAFGKCSFTSPYLVTVENGAAPPTVRFVFGPGSDPDISDVLVDAVESTGEFRPPK